MKPHLFPNANAAGRKRKTRSVSAATVATVAIALSAPQASANGFTPSETTGTQGSATINLSTTLGQKTPAKIFSVETIVVPQSAQWKEFVTLNNTSLALFSLSVMSGTVADAQFGLKLEFTAKGELQAVACPNAMAHCTSVDMRRAGGAFQIKYRNVILEVRPDENPCSAGAGKCSVTIPSWSLANLKRNKGLVEGPKVAAIVQHAGGISILDAQTGKVFFEFGKGTQNFPFKKLQSAHFNHDGTLRLNFANGLLLANFAKDEFFVAKPGELWHGVATLAASQASSLEQVAVLDDMNRDELPLFINGSRAIWTSDMVRYKRLDGSIPRSMQTLDQPYQKLARVIETSEGLRGLSILSEKSIAILHIGSDSNRSAPVRRIELLGGSSQIPNLVLVGDELYQRTSAGYYLHGKNGAAALSITKAGDRVRLTDSGHAFWPSSNRTEGCKLTHAVHDAGEAAKYNQTGFLLPCELKEKASITSDGIAAPELGGDQLKVHLWLPRRE
jgi:hypothetical protein